MATPVIAAISEQFITIDTEYSLRVGITEDPEEVTVDGLLEGFAYTWHEDDDEVEIFGEATRLLGDATWTVSAKETPTSAAATRDITYNVIPAVPIIEEIGTQIIFRDAIANIFIPIDNKATQIVIDGLLVGMKYEQDKRGQGDDLQEGVRISGALPLSSNLTVDETDFNISVMNDGGEDTYTLPVEIRELSLYLFNGTTEDIIKVSGGGSEVWTYEAPSSSEIYRPLSVGLDGSSYLLTGTTLRKIDSDGSSVWTYTLSNQNYDIPVIADDGSVYLLWDADNRLIKLSASGSLVWTYNAPAGAYEEIVVDNLGNVYLFDDTKDDLLKVGADGVLDWTHEARASGLFRQPVVVSDGSIYISSQNVVYKINPSGDEDWFYASGSSQHTFVRPLPAPDNGVYTFNHSTDELRRISAGGDLVWTYNAPSGTYRNPSVAPDGSVYLFHVGNSNLYKVAPDGSLAWTYSAPSGEYEHPVAAIDNNVYLFDDTADDLLKVNGDGMLAWTYNASTGVYDTNMPLFGR